MNTMDLFGTACDAPARAGRPALGRHHYHDLLDAHERAEIGLPQHFAPTARAMFETEAHLVEVFRSGASCKNDFAGFAAAGCPVGVTLPNLTKAVREAVVAYVDSGGRVFVDSGAVSVYTETARSGLDFDGVFDAYDALVRSVKHPQGLCVVACDVLGDQARTLALQTQFAGRIRRLLDLGAEVIVPLQRGPLSASQAYAKTAATLGRADFVVGIPSRFECFTEAQIGELLAVDRPGRVHFLGLTAKTRLGRLAGLAAVASPTTRVSSDACRLKAQAGSGRRLTDYHRTMLVDVACHAAYAPLDQAEATGVMNLDLYGMNLLEAGGMDAEDALLLAGWLGALGPVWGERFVAAAREGTLPDLFAEIDPDEEWAEQRFASYTRFLYWGYARKVLSPRCRRAVIRRMTVQSAL